MYAKNQKAFGAYTYRGFNSDIAAADGAGLRHGTYNR